jgi:hypothetical protein
LDDGDVSYSEFIDEHTEVVGALLCQLIHLVFFECGDGCFFIEIPFYVVCLGVMVIYEAADTAFCVFVFVLDVQQFEAIWLDALLEVKPELFAFGDVTDFRWFFYRVDEILTC